MTRWLGAALAAALAVSGAADARTAAPFSLAANARKPGVRQTASGLQYRVIKPGKGATPASDDVALVRYVGKLTDGTTFDASTTPVPLPVDAVVPGFAEGLRLMRRGAVYRLWIKPELGYGASEQRNDQGKLILPANATLVFDVTLVDFTPRAAYDAMRRKAGIN